MIKILSFILLSQITLAIFNNKTNEFTVSNNNGLSQLPIDPNAATNSTSQNKNSLNVAVPSGNGLQPIPQNAGQRGQSVSLNNQQANVDASTGAKFVDGVAIQESNMPGPAAPLMKLDPNNRVEPVGLQNGGGSLQTTELSLQPLKEFNNTNNESTLNKPKDLQELQPLNPNRPSSGSSNESSSQEVSAQSNYVTFGMNPEEELKFQSLFSKILNYGLLSMFTDLTDQKTTINLLLVLKQKKEIAGKDVYKVVFKVDNQKYATGSIYYGAEFAIPAGFTSAEPNQIDFISFGKSVILKNVLEMLGIDQSFLKSINDLSFLNDTKDAQGLDFSSQSKAAMVQFIQTILALTGTGSAGQGQGQGQGQGGENGNELIGSSNGKDDIIDFFQ
jgi:hypothetical protein